ncbi:hypothetical protein M569_10617 [Genlisea aurea]|uniref:Uncharacterized protein n=1 Tax=Genlisea aurea TaxID=192259 RepID=S8CBC3_9LAMI|nr:hypothetical protein M569_10617 [Genlisea aurea]
MASSPSSSSSPRDLTGASASSSPRTPTRLRGHEVNPLLPSSGSSSPARSNGRESGNGSRAVEIEAPESEGGDSVPAFSWKKMLKFSGPGFLMSVAFLDPGNLEGDLQSGAVAGYSLLWLLLATTLMGLLIQILAMKLGVATGRDLAEICRDEYPFWSRITLWVMAEIALIGADIQEVIGSAIAIKILSNGVLPLWAGVLITAADCFIFLLLDDNYGVKFLEAFFALLISIMAISFGWMFLESAPSGAHLLRGLLVPKLTSASIQQAVGVVGCVITPYNVFLYSALVPPRVDRSRRRLVREAMNYFTIESWVAVSASFLINLFVMSVFAEGFHGAPEAETIGLVNAGEFLQRRFGGGNFPILYIWGIGLLAAGQSSTISGTYAGQFIMGGFLHLPISPWLRSLITRSCAILPTIIVAVMFKRSEQLLDVINEWLNVLQALQIPFAILPLLHLVADDRIMGSFAITADLQKICWIVAGLVISVNGYVLVDFFVSKVGGFVLRFLVFLGGGAYVAFVVYLISHGRRRAAGFSYLRT